MNFLELPCRMNISYLNRSKCRLPVITVLVAKAGFTIRIHLLWRLIFRPKAFFEPIFWAQRIIRICLMASCKGIMKH